MRYVIRACLAMALAVAGVVATSVAANAWRSQSDCGVHAQVFHTNRWDTFSTHHMDVSLGICTNGTYVFWSKTPKVTFPCKVPIMCTGENLSVSTAPFVSSIQGSGNKVTMVTFRWEVKQCIPVQPLCQTFDFTAKTYPVGNQLCFVGGACDGRELWD